MGGMFDIGWIMFSLGFWNCEKKRSGEYRFWDIEFDEIGFKSSSQSGKAFLILIFLERNDIERYIYIYMYILCKCRNIVHICRAYHISRLDRKMNVVTFEFFAICISRLLHLRRRESNSRRRIFFAVPPSAL